MMDGCGAKSLPIEVQQNKKKRSPGYVGPAPHHTPYKFTYHLYKQ